MRTVGATVAAAAGSPLALPKLGAASSPAPAPWSPTELFSSGQQGFIWRIHEIGDLYQDDARSIAAAIDADVGGIADHAGNSLHAGQDNANLRPHLRKPGDYYYLEGGTHYLTVDVSAVDLSQPWLAAVVYEESSGSGKPNILSLNDATSSEYLGVEVNADGNIKIASAGRTPGNGGSGTGKRVLGLQWDGSELSCYLDDAFEYAVTPNSMPWGQLDNFALMAIYANGTPGQYANKAYGAAFVADSVGAQDRSQLFTWMAEKTGVSLA